MSEELEKVATNEAATGEVVDPNKKQKKPKSKAQKIIEWILFGIFMAIFAFLGAGVVDGLIHKNENYNQNLRFGYGTFYVLTNSMEPRYHKGTALITYKEDLTKLTDQLKAVKNANIVRNDDEQFVIAFDKNISYDMTFMNVATNIHEGTFDFVYDEYNPNVSPDANCVTTGKIMTHRIRELHIFKNVKYGKGRFVFVTSGINDQGEQSRIGQFQFVTEKQYLGIVKVNSDALGKVFDFISSIWGLLILLLVPAFYLIVTSGIDIFKAMKEAETDSENGGQAPENLDNISSEDRARLKQELLDEMIANKKKQKEEKDEEE